MAERKPIIPENQLLDLIQNPKKAEGLAQKQIQQRKWLSLFSLVALKGRLSFFSEKVKLSSKAVALDLHGINKALNFLTGALLIYFVGYSAVSIRNLNHMPTFTVNSPRVSSEAQEESAVFKKISDYLDKSHERNIFKFAEAPAPAVKEKEETPPPEAVSASEDDSTFSHLKLVGISFSSDPDVMIKDEKTQNIHFLKRGDRIGDIKVEAILRDRVILSSNGKETELR